MKKMKIIAISTLLMLVVGCGNKDLKNAYKNMQVGDNNINGYSLDLRINGTHKDERIREIVRIKNYKNKEYEIKIIDSKTLLDEDNEEIFYIKDGKTYTKVNENNYIETTALVKYKDPGIYLEGLNNIAKRGEEQEEIIANKTYKVYEVEFKKNMVDKLIQNSNLSDLPNNKNIDGKIYLNEDGQVYRIIYNIGEIEINANYYGINTAREIIMPIE
ncbi:MAG: hypothetical protein PHY00_04370 [Bacilli bacterium]|nr:hypothetical protein [Bacilli bacterium]